MPGFPTVNFSNSDKGLFTPEEIRRLMRIEFERAQRYEYPIVCMLIEVDRLESLHDLYGVESKEEILNSVIELLRSMTRSSDFLGCLREDRLMVMFPHTPREVANKLADRLIKGAHKLRFDSDGRTLRTTLSIGGSYCQDGERLTFDQFQQAAEDAVVLAHRGGGDRFVRARPRAEERAPGAARADRGAHRRAARGAAEGRPLPVPRGHPDPGPGALAAPGGGARGAARHGARQEAARAVPADRAPDARYRVRFSARSSTSCSRTSSSCAPRSPRASSRSATARSTPSSAACASSRASSSSTEDELRRVAAMKDVDPGISLDLPLGPGPSGAEQIISCGVRS